MTRKIILSLAMSLDGYIATKDDKFDWILGDGDNSLNTKEFWNFPEFLKTVDTIVMGSRCYDLGQHKDFTDKEVFIATFKKLEDKDNLHFINGNIVEAVLENNHQSDKNIFIWGGGGLVHNFLESSEIDEFYIGIVPVILGDGIPLFRGKTPSIRLHLEKIMSENGIVVLKYSKKSPV
ncbi:MAG: dihydrofolate reductase family protein [Candidatus Shapirobacteria bacterium]|jgi:dihydrofolate reductase